MHASLKSLRKASTNGQPTPSCFEVNDQKIDFIRQWREAANEG